MASGNSSASDLAAATPADRDRWIDFLRAFSIAAVVFGHWLVAVIVLEDGTVAGFNALERIPQLWPLTWVLQVMPIFFFVGGFSNLVSLRASRRRGEGYAGFIQGRFVRLLRPTVAFLAPAVVVVGTLDALNVADDFVFPVAELITGPLWFLAVYMIVIVLTPPMAALHDRFGLGAALGLLVAAVVVDVLRFGLDLSGVGYANYAIVWLLAHQWGFLYAEGSLRPTLGRWLAPLGLAATALLVALGPYQQSMVGLATDEFSNMDPPTLPILTLTIWEIGLALWLRRPVARWLEGRRPWTGVVVVNSVIMTAFLWHLTVLVVVVGVLLPLGFPQPEVGTSAWWLLRPVWIMILLLVLGGVVALLGGVERRGLARRHAGSPPDRVSALLGSIGAVLVLWGILGFAIGGLAQLFSPTGESFLGLRFNPFQNVVHIAWGATVMALADSERRRWAAAGSLVLGSILAAAGPLLRDGLAKNVLALNAGADGVHLAVALAAVVALTLQLTTRGRKLSADS